MTADELSRFVEEFEARTLPKSRWTHHAHLLVALWYLLHHSAEESLGILRRRIRAYNEAVGTPNTDAEGYHETLTRLYVRGVDAHLILHGESPLERSAEALLRSPLGDKHWPLTYYSPEVLFAARARREWVEPDLAAPPFGAESARRRSDAPRPIGSEP